MVERLESNGWDRATREPQQLPPPGSCDTAVHVYGPMAMGRLSPKRTYDPPEADINDLKRVHATLGIDRAVIIQPTIYDSDHRILLNALRQTPSGYRGIALINEQTSDQELDILQEAGVCGARFNFLSSLNIDWSAPRFLNCVERITDRGWVVLVHGTVDELLERADMLCQVKAPVVVDHMAHWDITTDPVGGAKHQKLCQLLQQDNFWIKLSNGDRFSKLGPPFDDMVALGRSFAEWIPERAIWASDWPHILYRGPVPNDAELLELLYRYAPDPSLQKRILVDNPQRLFRFA